MMEKIRQVETFLVVTVLYYCILLPFVLIWRMVGKKEKPGWARWTIDRDVRRQG